ncbi:multisubunit Na+/H+ antiporter MnhF subunit [Bacillus thermophilus]|uniref:Multisubunit Na+/H+ antiporter MnhF subunit n=1 Tax=Siminovitchia thermophila TaxID=1245522 RepID=A0ABS2R8D5_9BACI|nr:multisubunit Na+/H+ antiporter MnhF subunit [Siminovitchia thermophila]
MENTFLIVFLYIIVPLLGFLATYILTKYKNREGGHS